MRSENLLNSIYSWCHLWTIPNSIVFPISDDNVPSSSSSCDDGKDKNLENGKPRRSRTNFTIEQLNQVGQNNNGTCKIEILKHFNYDYSQTCVKRPTTIGTQK